MKVPSTVLMPFVHDALREGTPVRMTVQGSSMHPFFYDGDIVEIVAISGKLNIGMVALACRPNGEYVLHRVVGIDGSLVYLLGDAQCRVEGPFTRENLLGIVQAVYRRGRFVEVNRGWRWLAALCWLRLVPCRPTFFKNTVRARRAAQLARRCLRK